MRALLALAVLACGHPAPPPKSLQLDARDRMVDIETAVVAGYVTVVDFWSESCAPCHVAGAKLVAGVADQAQILIRKVDVGDGLSAVARAYEIGALPHYRIYDRHRRLRYFLVGDDCLAAAELARGLVAEP